MKVAKTLFCLLLSTLFISCMSGHASYEEGNSAPINASESNLYKQALLRCHKTGGTRVVKIQGKLRCF